MKAEWPEVGHRIIRTPYYLLYTHILLSQFKFLNRNAQGDFQYLE